jgi:hypothetical protein
MRGDWLVGALFAASLGCNGLGFTVQREASDAEADAGDEASAGDIDAAEAGGPRCEGAFEEPDAACTSTLDCAYFLHAVDCCGTARATAVRRGDQAAAYASELVWSARCVTCRCAPASTRVEADDAACKDDAIDVRCTAGRCETYCR